MDCGAGDIAEFVPEEGVVDSELYVEGILRFLRTNKLSCVTLNRNVTITSIEDQKDRNIVIAIAFNRQEGFTEVNSIRSVYGRDNMEYFIGETLI